jgi:hypothetical protein
VCVGLFKQRQAEADKEVGPDEDEDEDVGVEADVDEDAVDADDGMRTLRKTMPKLHRVVIRLPMRTMVTKTLSTTTATSSVRMMSDLYLLLFLRML